MADVPKNGYSYTGYTEPFICPVDATIAGGALLTAIVPVQFADVVGAVPIEYTEFRNAGLFVRSAETANTVATFTTRQINFDGQSRMQTGHGIFILDIGGVFCEVGGVTYDVATELYTIEVTNTPNVVEGTPYKVVGRIPDTGGASAPAGAGYIAGDKVLVAYP